MVIMPKRKTPEKLTEWEAGQVLIKASDCLWECVGELSDEYPQYAKELKKMARRVGSIFNGHGSHVFGLRDENDAC